MPRPRARIQNAILLGVSLALATLAAEGVARLVYGEGNLYRVDPYEHHGLRPYLDVVKRDWGAGGPFRLVTNSLGWRDTVPGRVVERVSSHRARIVLLGDSFVESIGINLENSVSGETERLLRQAGHDVEVLNAGTSSYAPLLEYVRLKRFLDRGYRADAVVLLVDVSDVPDEVIYHLQYVFDAGGEPMRAKGRSYHPAVAALLNHSALSRAAMNAYQEFRAWLARAPVDAGDRGTEGSRSVPAANAPGAGAMPKEVFVAHFAGDPVLRAGWPGDPPSLNGWVRDGVAYLQQDLRRIKRLCDAHHLPLVLVVYPWPQHLYVQSDPVRYRQLADYFGPLYQLRAKVFGERPAAMYDVYRNAVKEVADTEGIALVDLIPDIINRRDNHDLYLPKDVHFNERGHLLVAERIAESLNALLIR